MSKWHPLPVVLTSVLKRKIWSNKLVWKNQYLSYFFLFAKAFLFWFWAESVWKYFFIFPTKTKLKNSINHFNKWMLLFTINLLASISYTLNYIKTWFFFSVLIYENQESSWYNSGNLQGRRDLSWKLNWLESFCERVFGELLQASRIQMMASVWDYIKHLV